MTYNNHIIQTQTIDISFANMDAGIGMQNHIAELFYDRLQPGMNKLFDEIAGADYTAAIDKLEIDCGILPGKNWEGELVDSVLRKLKEELITVQKKKINTDEINDAFFYFLEHGLLPWNSNIHAEKAFEEKLVIDGWFIAQLQIKLLQPAVVTRLVGRFSEKFITGIIEALLQENKDKIDGQLLQIDFSHQPLPDHRHQEKIIKAIVKQSSKTGKAADDGKAQKNNNTSGQDIKKENSAGVFIRNAGLIIVHPFLPALFENLQLTKNNEWVSEEARQQAIAVTEFLVTGETNAPEFNLTLNKLLCGFEAADVLLRTDDFDIAMQQACEEMLREVIMLWSSLKNTGIDAFRETFLQRTGKLSVKGSAGLLQVEQKATDVLLNTLPWGIGVIKLPWMKEVLFTEWNG